MSVLSPETDLEDDGIELDDIDQEKQSATFKTMRAKLREANKEVKRLRPFEEIATAKSLDDTFEKAGLKDLDGPKRKAVLALAGESKDADALKAQALALGFVANPNAAAEAAAAGDAAIAGLTAGSSEHAAGGAPSLQQQITAAETKAKASGARRDWEDLSALKVQLLPKPKTE